VSDNAPEAVAPGTDGVQGAYPDPISPAAAQNTEQGQGEPGPIPYTRFKEVNDQLRPYKELERVGYDADSLRGLAEWEQTFRGDPVSNWMQIAKNIEGLPEGVQMAIADFYDEPYDTEDYSDVSDDGEGETGQTVVDPLQDERVRNAIEYTEARQRRDEQEARLGVLNEIQDGWRALDKQQNIEDPVDEQTMLTLIAGSAGTGGSKDEILQNARATWLNIRKGAQSSMVKTGPLPGLPPAVPGGAAPTTAGAPRPKTFAEMNALILAAQENGTLGG
jgi:hypothetical protein